MLLLIGYLVQPHIAKAQFFYEGKNMSLTGHWSDGTGGKLSIIEVKDNLVFMALEYHVEIYDFTDIHDPEFVSRYYVANKVSGLKAVEDTLYILSTGLTVLDISDPYNPSVIKSGAVRSSSTLSIQNDLAVIDDVAFAGGGYSVGVIDISKSDTISAIGTYRTENSNHSAMINIEQAGQNLLVAEITGVKLVDFSNPSEPSVVSEFKRNDKSLHVDQVYVADNNVFLSEIPDVFGVIDGNTSELQHGLSIWDASNPAEPQLLSYLEYSEDEIAIIITSMVLVGDLLFLLEADAYTNERRITAIDVSDIENPTKLGIVDFPANISSLVPYGEYLLATSNHSIQIIDYSNPTSFQIVDRIDLSGESKEVIDSKVHNDSAVLQLRDSLQFVNISDLSNPATVNSWEQPFSITGMHRLENKLFLYGSSDVALADISDMTDPELLSTYELDHAVRNVVYAHPFLFVCTDDLLVYDYSNLEQVSIANTYHIENGTCKEIAMDGEQLYMLTTIQEIVDPTNYLEILDISDVQSINNLFTSSGFYDDVITNVYVNNGTLFLLDHRMHKYDVTTPSSPVLSDSYELRTYGLTDVVVDDDLIHLAYRQFVDDPARILTFDYNFEPVDMSFKVVGSEEIHSLSIHNTYIFASWGTRGLYIIERDLGYDTSVQDDVKPVAHSPKLYQNYPNPFNPATTIMYQINSTTNVRLVIYDVIGRELETLVNQVQTPGIYDISFSANRYSSGVYFYKLHTDQKSIVRQMTIVK